MGTWSHHVILLIIISNNILLSPPIALTYHFVPNSSSFWYLKSHLLIIGNWFFYIILLRSVPAAILFVGKHNIRHSTIISTSTYQHPICWDAIFLDSILLKSRSPLIALQLRVNDAVINLFPARLTFCGLVRKYLWSILNPRPMKPLYRW